jgi:predicted DNA-binding protein (MmcQ/YjbR family)
MIANPISLFHLCPMNRDTVNQICVVFAGSTSADPATELDSWKVGGKMFACFGDRINGVCTKTDSIETATMLIDAGAATKAPYFHKSWVLVDFDASDDEMRHRLQVSYDIIVKALPKRLRP